MDSAFYTRTKKKPAIMRLGKMKSIKITPIKSIKITPMCGSEITRFTS